MDRKTMKVGCGMIPSLVGYPDCSTHPCAPSQDTQTE